MSKDFNQSYVKILKKSGRLVMKIALACKSILLERALKIFLERYIVPYKQCEFIIADTKISSDKPLFIIGKNEAHVPVPFSKTSLMLALEEFYTCITGKTIQKSESIDKEKEQESFEKLENKITVLTEKFRNDLIDTIKAHYEKD